MSSWRPPGSHRGRGLALADLPAGWLERLDAVLLGPGIGHDVHGAPDPPRGWIPAAEVERWRQLQEFSGLVVVDADGLNRLARGVGEEADSDGEDGPGGAAASQWLRYRHGPTWITPHQGEFARLFPDLAGQPPLEAAGAAARRSGVTVLLKGARTVVASSDGRRWQLLGACPDAARAGLGDVLAGYGAGKGAMAMAAARASGMAEGLDASLLAAAALNHAQAGLQVRHKRGSGGVTPMAVAAALEKQPDGTTANGSIGSNSTDPG
jgi:NAD(P)H-hydrate repair Nnr-like enzyme with NAD(P)H-hydrate dehydratase domain